MAKYKWSLASDFIQNGKLNKAVAGDLIEFEGFSESGVGAGTWKFTGNENLTPSQTPAGRGAAELVDGSGRLWELVGSYSNIAAALGVAESAAKQFLNDGLENNFTVKKLSLNNDMSVPSATNNSIFARDKASESGNSTTVQIQRVADTETGANPKAIRALTTISSGVDSVEYAMSAELENNSDAVNGGASASSAVSIKNAKGNTFAGHFQVKDTQGLPSSVGGSMIGQELNIQANGADDSQVRIGYDVIARTYQPNFATDGEGEFFAGIRIRNSVLGAEGGRWVHAIKIEDGVSPIGYGVSVNISSDKSDGYGFSDSGSKPYGFRALGQYSQAAIDVRQGTGQVTVNVFGGESGAGNSAAQIAIGGKNSGGASVSYSRLRSIVQTNTAGAEGGRTDIDFKSGGSFVTGVQLSSNSVSNPLFVRVGGSLKQVTEGAADSAGSGFKVLKVPN